jgi:hypothetical protein
MKEKLFKIQNMGLKFEKDSKNPFYKSDYLSLEGLWSTLQPVLEKERLVVTHGTKEKEVVTRVLDLDSDEVVESSMPLPDNLDPQKLGSAVTYYKRYNLGQIFNIMTDEDDDGNKTVKPVVAKKATPVADVEDIIG